MNTGEMFFCPILCCKIDYGWSIERQKYFNSILIVTTNTASTSSHLFNQIYVNSTSSLVNFDYRLHSNNIMQTLVVIVHVSMWPTFYIKSTLYFRVQLSLCVACTLYTVHRNPSATDWMPSSLLIVCTHRFWPKNILQMFIRVCVCVCVRATD